MPDVAELLPPSSSDARVLPRIEILTENIRRNHSEGHKRFFEVGCDLLEAKSLLPHGEFGQWLRNEFSMSTSTAQRYMRFARATQRLRGAYGLNASALTYLPTEVVIAFWNAPLNIRDQIADAIQAGYKPTETQIYDQIFKRQPYRSCPSQFSSEQFDKELDNQQPIPQQDGAETAAQEAIAMLLERFTADDLASFKTLYARAGVAFDAELFRDAEAA